MANTTNSFADTTDRAAPIGVIDDALLSLRISGSVLLREAYAPPWSIAVPDKVGLSALLGQGPGAQVVAFHLVEFGHCAIQPEGGPETLLTAGEIAIFFGGAAHRLSQGEPTETMDIESLVTCGDNPRSPAMVGQPVGASLLCGAFVLHDTVLNPLFAALPPILHESLSRAGELHNLSGVARLMAEELDRRLPGGGYVVERLLEVLCAEAVRAHMESVPREEPNWFRGIKDAVVGKAIAAFHARPGDAWSVPRLAAVVCMSPSRFAARFTAAVGDSPMVYVTKWRMNAACRLLKASQISIDKVAADTGYESQAAFSRAFKKHVGVSPVTWRAGSVRVG